MTENDFYDIIYTDTDASVGDKTMKATNYKHGIDNVGSLDSLLSGKRLGLITNPTGVGSDMRSSVDALREKYDLRLLCGPEHGITGAAQAGVKVGHSTDERSGLPVISMYAAKEDGRAFSDVDIMLFDIQDIGVRFYTYIYTLSDAMRLCADAEIPLAVLDRYNPLGLYRTEGTLLDEKFSSGVGRFELPSRHALTVGEYARYVNAEKGIGCELHVCPCTGLDRNMDGRDISLPWIPPSPNIPTLETVRAYVGTVIFEGTNMSEGRGTTKPFEIIGAPWLRNYEVCDYMNSQGLSGVWFRPCEYIPTFSKFAGELCHGIQLHITDPDSFEAFRTGILLLDRIRRTHTEFAFLYWEKSGVHFIDHLLGTDAVRSSDFDAEQFIADERKRIDEFLPRLEKYKIY